MIARLQQFVTLSLLVLTATATVVFDEVGHPWWAVVAVAVLALGHVAVLGLEFFLMAAVARRTSAARPRLWTIFCAWLSEALHAPRAFCWRQPFRSRAWPDCLPDAPGGSRGVLLVHGLWCNRGFWNPWMAKLHAQGTPFVAVNLEPIGGLLDGDLAAVDAAVSAMTAATGRLPVLVAHSRGGLVIRAWAAAPGNLYRAHRMVTIGAPHGGTWMARFAASRGSVEMRLDSPWLDDLRARETAEHYARFTCFYSQCDNIVFLAFTATLPGADNREVTGCAHIQMAFAPEVFAEVQRWLASDPTRTTSTAIARHTLARGQKTLSRSSKTSGASSADAATRR